MLGVIGLCAFVLDAFEIIFVVVPIVMPPLLIRVADARWVSVLVLLTLQASFLLPPFGYALMMVRGTLRMRRLPRFMRALLPFLLAQWLVLATVLFVPALVHVGEKASDRTRASEPGVERRAEPPSAGHAARTARSRPAAAEVSGAAPWGALGRSPPPLEKGRSASAASRVASCGEAATDPFPALPLSGGGSAPPEARASTRNDTACRIIVAALRLSCVLAAEQPGRHV